MPLPITARDAIDASNPLRQLLARRRQAEARFRVISPLVPAELRDYVGVGLAEGTSAAAKLRQLMPRFEAALREAGLAQPPVAIRVRSR